MPIAAAVPSIITGAGSLLGGIFGSNAAKAAGNAQANALNQGIQNTNQAVQGFQGDVTNANNTLGNVLGWQQDQANTVLGQQQQGTQNTLNQQQGALNPYMQAGTAGLSSLTNALSPGGGLTNQFSFDPAQIANNPNYQFELGEGLKAVQRSAAATGTLNSGGTLKGIAQYTQGLASNEIGQAYNQALNTFNTNRAATLQNAMLPIGIGQQATSQYQNALQNYGALNQNALQNYGALGAGALQNYGNLNSSNLLASGQAGIQGAFQNNQLLAGIGNAQAGKDLGAQKAWSGALTGVTDSLASKDFLNTMGQMTWAGGGGTTAPQYQSPYGAYPYSTTPYGTGTNFGASGGVPGYGNSLLNSQMSLPGYGG